MLIKIHWMGGCIPPLLVLLLFSVTVVHGRQTAAPPAQQSPFLFSQATTIIYVSDFELDAQNFQADEGRAKVVQRPGILNGPRKQEKDPEVQAKKMVDLMATDIVNNLKKAGYKAQRLSATDARPATGVWVHGIFCDFIPSIRLPECRGPLPRRLWTCPPPALDTRQIASPSGSPNGSAFGATLIVTIC